MNIQHYILYCTPLYYVLYSPLVLVLSAFPRCRRDLTHVCFAYAVPTKGTVEFPVRYRPIYVHTENDNGKRVTNVKDHVCFAQSTVIMDSISNANERFIIFVCYISYLLHLYYFCTL